MRIPPIASHVMLPVLHLPQASGAKGVPITDGTAADHHEGALKQDLAEAKAPTPCTRRLPNPQDALAANAAAVDTGADDAVSRTRQSLSDYTSGAKDASVDSAAAAAEPEPAADTVDSDTAKAIFAAHEPSPNAVFWSKLARRTMPTAPTGAIKGTLKKDIPAAKTGAEASFDETGVINDPALGPVTQVATAFKPAATGGTPLPSIKEFPEEERLAFCAPASADPLPDPIPLPRRRATPTGSSRPRSFPRSTRPSRQ